MERHGYSARLCDRLETLAWGEAAARLLQSPKLIVRSGVVLLPIFVWDTPKRDAGRKTRGTNGPLALPSKVLWQGGVDTIVVLHPEEIIEIKWRSGGAKNVANRGVTTLNAAATKPPETGRDADGFFTNVPRGLTTTIESRANVRRRLLTLVEEGRRARWEILRMFEDNLRWNFEHALRSVREEMKITSPRVIEAAASEALQNQILFGDDGTDESLAFRLIDRCVQGQDFARVDPEQYVRRWMFSTAESAIRRHIGDPHIGRKIRQVATELDTDDVDEVVSEYARRFPRQSLGPRRAKEALSAASRVREATPSRSFGSLDEDGSLRGYRQRP